jgi:hypothetical protein
MKKKDGRATNGGKRSHAGRKSDKQLNDLHSMMDAVVPIKQQKRIIANLALMAATDSLAAYRFLTLRYGLPTQRVETDSLILINLGK